MWLKNDFNFLIMKLTILISIILTANFTLKAQNYIPFRNTLNEANYWFYEAEYDSACKYYTLAEKFDLKFYRAESHLYSRSLWEIGNKKKSVEIVIKGGSRFSFINDTSFYKGMTKEERVKINTLLPEDNSWQILKDSVLFDTIFKRDSQYRKAIKQWKDTTHFVYKDLWKKQNYNDSLNRIEIIEYIKKNGFPGGYYQVHPVFDQVFLHSSKEWLFDNYNLFIAEIKAGRLDPNRYSRAFDRFNINKNTCKTGMMYNSFFGVDSSQSLSPELVFLNSCNIGLDPYYENYNSAVFRRGFKPNKTPLFDYYKQQKERFNASKIQN